MSKSRDVLAAPHEQRRNAVQGECQSERLRSPLRPGQKLERLPQCLVWKSQIRGTERRVEKARRHQMFFPRSEVFAAFEQADALLRMCPRANEVAHQPKED